MNSSIGSESALGFLCRFRTFNNFFGERRGRSTVTEPVFFDFVRQCTTDQQAVKKMWLGLPLIGGAVLTTNHHKRGQSHRVNGVQLQSSQFRDLFWRHQSHLPILNTSHKTTSVRQPMQGCYYRKSMVNKDNKLCVLESYIEANSRCFVESYKISNLNFFSYF